MSKETNCPNCGAPIGLDPICPYCGTRLQWVPFVTERIVIEQPKVQTLRQNVSITWDMMHHLRENGGLERIKDHLCINMARSLKPLLIFEEYSDLETASIILTAALRVVAPGGDQYA